MIYFIEAEGAGLVKIGFANSVKRRMKTLATSSPFELRLVVEIPGSIKDEKDLHRRFRHLRHNREWFRMDNEILAFIDDAVCGQITEFINGKPVFACRINGHLWGDCNGFQCCYASFYCPKCGQENNHGFCPGLDWNSAPTHRHSHCRCWPEGYYIKADERLDVHEIPPNVAVPVIPKQRRFNDR